eukprot:gene33044-42754_t
MKNTASGSAKGYPIRANKTFSVLKTLLATAFCVFCVVLIFLAKLLSNHPAEEAKDILRTLNILAKWNDTKISAPLVREQQITQLRKENKVVKAHSETISEYSDVEESVKSSILHLPPLPVMVESKIQDLNSSPKNRQYQVFGGADATHKILTLSDGVLSSTPIDEMMSWYGEAKGGGSCSKDFGNTLVNRWRREKKPYCSPAAGGGSPSSVDCYLVQQTRHHGNGDNLCVMRNVQVDFGRVFGSSSDAFTRPVVENYVHTHHNEQPYIAYPAGFVTAKGCHPDQSLWTPRFFPGWNNDWTTRATTFGDGEVECDERVDHRVLVVQRDTFANFFHDSEDFVNVFLALAVLQWKMEDTQIYLTDLYPEGPFWEMWSKVYSSKTSDLPTLTAWDLKHRYPEQPRKKVCFKELAIGIYGPAAPITVASWDTPCSHTALVRAYSDFVIRGLGLQEFTHYAQPEPNRTIVITYMARRASKEWPEKKYCNSTGSFFLCHLWAGFGSRALGRMVANDVLTFEEQIKIDLSTDIMVGPHGAGLMHNIFMRDRAALVELFVDGSSVNRHFHNLASWFGRDYHGESVGNPVDSGMLLRLLQDIISRMDLNQY